MMRTRKRWKPKRDWWTPCRHVATRQELAIHRSLGEVAAQKTGIVTPICFNEEERTSTLGSIEREYPVRDETEGEAGMHLHAPTAWQFQAVQQRGKRILRHKRGMSMLSAGKFERNHDIGHGKRMF